MAFLYEVNPKKEEKLSQNIVQAQKWRWLQSIPMDKRVLK